MKPLQFASEQSPDGYLPPEVVAAAVDWLVHLWSGDATAESRAQWQAWRAASPLHDLAWRRIETTDARLRGPIDGGGGANLDANMAVATLERGRQRMGTRRALLRSVVGLGVTGGTALMAYRLLPWQSWSADVRTAKGEQRRMQLPDGTSLLLNTDTAINLRYSDSSRNVQLQRGEIFIATAKDKAMPARPFIIDTPAGSIRALGTQFIVRHEGANAAGDEGAATRVSVSEGAVEIRTLNHSVLRVNAGEATRFDAQAVQPAAPTPNDFIWEEGMLVVTNMPLRHFVDELRRYRSGFISLSPSVADLRLSGVFPLNNGSGAGDSGNGTDRILRTLESILPVRVRISMRYWVSINAA